MESITTPAVAAGRTAKGERIAEPSASTNSKTTAGAASLSWVPT